ncbi:PAS domain-containing sensor histidine kinase [Bacillus sp. FJAT-27245]|uniref:PAS domain-containing sensor histidine kinase n=1 Tax=Bacillus sp. FJAT-27245 TaxID=1684144 RepID=UPI0006A7681B|nr:ATP-binding protein [Bacillus sp. FJAT-27245]
MNSWEDKQGDSPAAVAFPESESPLGIFLLNSKGLFTAVEGEWETITGLNPNETIGQNFLDFFSPDPLLRSCDTLLPLIQNGKHTLFTKKGQTAFVTVTMLPILLDDGSLQGYTGALAPRPGSTLHKEHNSFQPNDLIFTLKAKISSEIEKNRQKDAILIQQSRLAAMGEMLASIGHQWRQPLNNLSMLFQEAREALEFGEINEQFADIFIKEGLEQVQVLSRTIHDIRRFYRRNLEKSFFSVADAIEDALSLFSPSLKKHEIEIEFIYRGQQMAFGYPNEFSQAILNLLANSRDAFVHKGSENRRISIAIEDKDGFSETVFTDNTGGIDPSNMAHIFDPHFTTRAGSTGLGLYMVKTIVERMKGSASAENNQSGTLFRLSIPKAFSRD